MGKNSKVVVAGHLCLDLTPQFLGEATANISELFVPGKLINMGNLTVATGGPVSNTGVALSKLGIDVSLMAKVGKDFIGQGVRDKFAEYGVESNLTEIDGADTSYTVALVPKGMDRIFLHCPGTNDTFDSDDLDYEAISKAGLFHLGYPPLMKKMYENGGEELYKIFKRVKELGVTTSLDMSLPDINSESGRADWHHILEKVLPYVDLFLPSIEESAFMVNRDLYNKLKETATSTDMLENLDINNLPPLGSKLIEMGAKIVALKSGVKGFYLKSASKEVLSQMGNCQVGDLDNWANRELHEESFNADPVLSATGSGDSSIAGLLSSLVRGHSIEHSIKFACAVGGLNVQAYDAISGIKTWEETKALIENGWQKNRLEVSGSYWRYDEANEVWIGKGDSKA